MCIIYEKERKRKTKKKMKQKNRNERNRKKKKKQPTVGRPKLGRRVARLQQRHQGSFLTFVVAFLR